MQARDEWEWNEEELEALQSLDREMEPGGDLEERTVARLRQEGLIRDPAVPWWKTFDWRAFLASWTPNRLAWASAASSLAVAIFFLGVALGERWALRGTADALAAFHEDNLMQASARVQQTGSAYVAALSALGQLATDSDPQKVSQGREAALAALYAAASQLVRLDPDDPVATRILQGFDDLQEARSTNDPTSESDERQVMWF